VSRLLERLRRAVRGEAPRPLGFGRPPADSGRVPPLVLVARLAEWDLDLVGGLRSAGFDLLVLPGRSEPPGPAELESLAGVTWGIDLTGPAAAGLAQAHFEAGADFVLIDPGAPAEILGREGSTYLALTPQQAEQLVARIQEAAARASSRGAEAVLLAPPLVRLHLRRLLEPVLPDLAVVSYAELLPTCRVEALEVVELAD